MKQNSKRLSSMLIALAFLVASFFLYFDFISPAYSTVLTTKGKALAGQQSIDAENKVITQAQALIAQYNDQTQAQQALAIALPSEPDIVGAVAQIYGIASTNGIVVQSIGVSAPAVPAAAKSSANASSTVLVRPLGTVTVQITGGGTYENFKAFLSDLETNLRIFDLQSLSISPNAASNAAAIKNGTGANPDFFTYNITVATYYQAP